MEKVSAVNVLFEGQADEYAQLINDHPMSHEDCMLVLNAVAFLKDRGISTEKIFNKITELLR